MAVVDDLKEITTLVGGEWSQSPVVEDEEFDMIVLAGDHPEAGWRRTSARYPDDPGPGGSSRRQDRVGADLRGGLRGQRLWLSTAS